MTRKDWPTPEEVHQAMGDHGERVALPVVSAVLDAAWAVMAERW